MLYTWRKNFTASVQDSEKTIRGKLAFKTKETHWLETKFPVVVLVSVHSSFHDVIAGNLKMNTLMTTIREHVKGPITVLFSDKAHLHTFSLNYLANDATHALKECVIAAKKLERRYKPYFGDCNVAYWHSYISQDASYPVFVDFLKKSLEIDASFRTLLYQDAFSTYTEERKLQCPDENLYVQKAIEDLIEQCVCLFVLANKGYRFQFYPGKPYNSVNYVNSVYLKSGNQIDWIDVFLTIEKKTFHDVLLTPPSRKVG